MALSTYSELCASIAGWLNRDDLTARIPDFVTLCEARLKRTVRTKSVTTADVDIASAASYCAVPTGALEIVSLSLNDDEYGGPLTLVSYPELMRYRACHPDAGTPEVACVIGNVIQFAPASNTALHLAVEYEGPFTALSGSNASNWILADHPDLYLFGALAESAPYLADDERIVVWNGRFEKAVEECELQRERRRWPGPVNVPVSRAFSDTPPR